MLIHDGKAVHVTLRQGTPLRIFLIRHGETAWSLSGQYTGRTDIHLTTHGEDEARELGLRLQNIPFTHVFTSPLTRAQQTCALVGLNATPEIVPDLTEWTTATTRDELRRTCWPRDQVGISFAMALQTVNRRRTFQHAPIE